MKVSRGGGFLIKKNFHRRHSINDIACLFPKIAKPGRQCTFELNCILGKRDLKNK